MFAMPMALFVTFGDVTVAIKFDVSQLSDLFACVEENHCNGSILECWMFENIFCFCLS